MEKRQYTLKWSLRGDMVSDSTGKKIRLNRRTNAIIYWIGFLGLLPGLYFDTVLKNVFLNLLATIGVYVVFAILVWYIFYRFLCRENARGRIEKYIDVKTSP